MLNEKWAAFIQGGVAMVAGSRDSTHIPILARAVGCRVSPNRQKVTLLLPGSQAESLITSVRSTGTIAAVFTQPSTHVSVQLKSAEATLSPARPSDVGVVNRCTDAFVDETHPWDIRRILSARFYGSIRQTWSL